MPSTNFNTLLAKYPPRHGERADKAVRKNAVTTPLALDTERDLGHTDWAKQDELHRFIGKPNATLNDPIPTRGVTQVKKKKPGKGK